MSERLTRELTTINDNITRIQEESDVKIQSLRKRMQSMKLDGESDRITQPVKLKEDSESQLNMMPPLDYSKSLEERLMNRVK